MSGVEVAGLVLAVLPLMISALEHYRDVEEVVEGWWKVKSEFKKCMRNLNYHKVAFEENLEELLLPLIADEDKLRSLLENPGGPEWKDPELEDMLQKRMPKTYASYLDTIEMLMETVQKLNEALGMSKFNFQTRVTEESQMEKTMSGTRKTIDQVAASVEFHSQRIRLAFNKATRQKLFEEFGSLNTRLREILGSSERLAGLRRSRATTKAPPGLWRFWTHGNSLFKFLAEAWSCKCQASHHANILLQHRTAPIVDFRIVFWFAQLAAVKQGHLPWVWQGTRIRLQEKNSQPKTIPLKVPLPLQAVAIMEVKEENSNSSSSSRTARPLNLKEQTTGPLKKSLKFWHNKSTSSKSEARGLSKTPNTSPCPPAVQSKVVNTRKVSFFETTTHVHEEDDLNSSRITDLCSKIGSCAEDLPEYGCLGKSGYLVQPLSKASRQPQHYISLEKLLSRQSPISLSRQKRFKIALIIASSHLQLYPTPWLESKWSKKDILFLYDEAGTLCSDQPYISRPLSTSIAAAEPNASPNNDPAYSFQDSIRNLGIMLLELCFGYAIEDHRSRPNTDSNDQQIIHLINYAIATQWCREVLEEAGPELADAISWCLHNIPENSGDDSSWREDMFAKVVEPLTYCHNQFKSI